MAAIEICGLNKFYGQARGVVDVDLEVKAGEIFGFIGPNGAGKSTTIRVLMNYIFPSGGSARIFGLDVVSDSVRVRELVGYLPAEVGYYDEMTAADLFRYAAGFYRGCSLDYAFELAQLFELDTKRKVHALSYGNKKKIGIILALLHRPKLLILDEPTGGLDPLMQRHFFELLRQLNAEGVTIFFSSHILDEVQRLCHRVGIIKEGRILKIETMDDLRHRHFRNVRVSFKEDPAEAPRLPGILHAQREHGAWHFLYAGDINPLLHYLSGQELNNLWLEEPNLEDVFLHYYEKEEK